jgi:hypothetical protein
MQDLVNTDNIGPTLIIDDEPEKKDIETHVLFAPQRLDNETYEEYTERRLVAHYKLHQMAKGNLIWNSRPDATKKGDTYRKVK